MSPRAIVDETDRLIADLEDEIETVPTLISDQLAEMYFWWDRADRAKRRFYHGRIIGSLDGGFYLIAFDRSDELPTGLHEVVHVSTMVEDNWSFYRKREDMCAAIVTKEDENDG